MNANNSFRTSITVLTVATIVGCVVMLFSGFSQFRLRPTGNEKAMVSSADQKLRNRFGEFYPVERRTAVAEPNVASSTAPAPGNVIHSASQSSTFNEVVTSSTDYDSTEYDSSEVMTSWSSGRSVGTPQVSVPVTINVNNGDLMATLIETREQLAEMKVRQSAVRDEQRVFSYEVHKNQANSVTSSDTNVAAAESSSVSATSSERHPTKPSTARAAKAEVKERAGKPSVPSVGDFSVEESVSFEPIAPPATPAADADDDATVPVIEPISYYVDQPFDEPAPVAQSAVLTESKRVTQSTQLSKETVVQFAPLDDAVTNNEVPASLPELNFGEPISEQSISEQTSDVPTLSIESQPEFAEFAEVSTSHAEAASSKKASADASLPDFFAAEANTASEETTAAASQPDQSSDTGFSASRSARTREELSRTFAAVRGLPPEDLFGDRTTAFVMPMDPAEPWPTTPVPEVPATEMAMPPASPESSSLASAGDSADNGKVTPTSPPRISFIESSGDRLVVHPSSAASPVDLEFGEPSAPGTALNQSDNPGSPHAPAMPLAEEKAERWHKYRSRVHIKSGASPSTPVPPIPEVAAGDMSVPSHSPFQEPALVPPAVDDSLAESGLNSSDIGNTITDSPLMFPDDDGTTEIARHGDSDKLSSSSLPPIPELAPVPVLSEPFGDNGSSANGSLVYEPQPVMDRIHEVQSELNSHPMVSSAPPMMTPRRMPQKSASDLPFSTTFRRIHKRVAWMSDAMHSTDKQTAQHKSHGTNSPTMKPAQPGRPSTTQKQGPAVAKKSSPSQPMQLPKLTVPKFTVQNFALPKVNFRPIQAPSFQMPRMDTPDWLACPPDLMAPVRNSTALHRVMSTVQFAGQPQVLK